MMAGYSTSNSRSSTTLGFFLFCILLVFLLWGCGSGTSEQGTSGSLASASTETGSASFAIQWHTTSADRASGLARQALNDCAAGEVDSITCEVYDESQNHIASGGPWNCSDHQGSIDMIPAGSNRILTVLGWTGTEGTGDTVYQGQAAGITINPGEIADTGTIDAYPFVPNLSSPADGQSVTANTFLLTWDSVATADQYRILVAEDSGFAVPIIDAQKSEISYAPNNLAASTTYYWKIRSIDMHDNESADSQVWHFSTDAIETCGAPVLNPIANQQVNEAATLTFTVNASDPDGGLLTYSASSLPQGATFDNATRTFDWTPGYGMAGNYPIIFSVCDDCPEAPLCDSEQMTITVGDVCWPPELSPIGNRQVNEAATLTFTVNAADPDGGTLTYSASSLPQGATFDSASRRFSWTPGYGAAGNYSVTFSVCDDCPEAPLCDSEQMTITVGGVCRPPVLTDPGDRQVAENDKLTFTLSATDPDGGTLTYSAIGLPDGANFNETTRTFSWTPDYGDAGNYPVTFTVCDDCPDEPLCNSQQVNIAVGDVCRSPNLTDPGDQQVTENNNLTFTLSATDPDGGTLTYSASGLPDGANFNSKTRTFSWTPGSGTAGSYDVKFTVCDNCLNGSLCDSEQVTITVLGALPVVTVTATEALAVEAAEFPDPGTYRISRSGSTSAPLRVYLTMGGTADNGKDYTTIPDYVTIGVRQSYVNITLAPLNDQNDEPNETAQLTIAADSAYSRGKPYIATITIIDDDQSLLIGCPLIKGSGGDLYYRGFYVPDYQGVNLSLVGLYFSAITPGTYTFSLTAREGSYSGRLLGTSTSSATLSDDITDFRATYFSFNQDPTVTPGSYVTFSINVTGPGTSVYYATSTDSDCPVVQTNDITPPLSTVRRNGIAVLIYGDLY
jgi:hypothetical protein